MVIMDVKWLPSMYFNGFILRVLKLPYKTFEHQISAE